MTERKWITDVFERQKKKKAEKAGLSIKLPHKQAENFLPFFFLLFFLYSLLLIHSETRRLLLQWVLLEGKREGRLNSVDLPQILS